MNKGTQTFLAWAFLASMTIVVKAEDDSSHFAPASIDPVVLRNMNLRSQELQNSLRNSLEKSGIPASTIDLNQIAGQIEKLKENYVGSALEKLPVSKIKETANSKELKFFLQNLLSKFVDPRTVNNMMVTIDEYLELLHKSLTLDKKTLSPPTETIQID